MKLSAVLYAARNRNSRLCTGLVIACELWLNQTVMNMDNSAKAFLEKFKSDIQKLRQTAPDTLKGFGTLFSAVMKDGALTTKQKELVALGIAVAQRCSPCIILHVQKCLEAGNSPAEIIEAASVAVMMQGGPAYTHLPVVLDAIEALTQKS